jgi:sporulation protein YlmC with PRC-barrel domain
MKTRKVHLERLLGRQVRDTEGARVGRILSVRAERQGQECLIREYHLGAAALMARLGLSALRLAGWPRRKPLVVPWDLLDLSDPDRPLLRCSLAELESKSRQGSR